MTNVDEIIEKIYKQTEINTNDSFFIGKICMKMLRKNGSEYLGRKIIAHILENWNKLNSNTYEYWGNIIESAGFYPYIEKSKIELNNLAGEIRKNYHKSNLIDGIYFHEEQLILKKIIDNGKNLVVSAPTSFGKSLLIEEIIASKKFKNIVIIQPTLALLDETRKKLKKYSEEYKIIVRTSQKTSEEKGNLFLLTAERVLEYKDLKKIDFLIIDEFYKLSAKRDDERSDTLNNACYKLFTEYAPRFYFLGPNIDGISTGFIEKYNAEFYKSNYSLVENRTIDIYTEHAEKFKMSRKYKNYKENILFELLFELRNEQTIIYCSSPSRVRELSFKYYIFLKDKINNIDTDVPLKEWIETNINKDWNVIELLNYKIGISDAALPKHINSSMISYFNESKLNTVFCTSTIIEGVNTNAKNIIIFDKKKGKNPIDFFDYSNIRGRSGRMMIHYIGKIYDFNKPPQKEKEMIVDIPFFHQNPIKDEVLIMLEERDILNKNSEQYKELLKIPFNEKEIFKRNGVLVSGQKKILEKLRNLNRIEIVKRGSYSKEYTIYELLNWNREPTYDQLQFIISICWNNLIKEGETTSPMTLPRLITLTFNYGINKNIYNTIHQDLAYKKIENAKKQKEKQKTEKELLNESIKDIFNIQRHWFQYKIPKWLSVIGELQKYICEKNGFNSGNYTYYSSQLENEFIRTNLTILSEFGIPTSAIKKIEGSIPSEIDEDNVLKFIKKNNIINNGLLSQYEREKLSENI